MKQIVVISGAPTFVETGKEDERAVEAGAMVSITTSEEHLQLIDKKVIVSPHFETLWVWIPVSKIDWLIGRLQHIKDDVKSLKL